MMKDLKKIINWFSVLLCLIARICQLGYIGEVKTGLVFNIALVERLSDNSLIAEDCTQLL